MKLSNFLVQSPTGTTHAINPKTKKTYCGFPQILASSEVTEHVLEDKGWRFLDKAPSDENPPSCKICRNHYDDPTRSVLREIADDLETNIHEYLSLRVMLKDVKAIGRFTETIANFLRNKKELVKTKTEAEA